MCGISADDFAAHLALSAIVGALLVFLGLAALARARGAERLLVFGAVDAGGRVQSAYGMAAFAAAGATLVCPFLPHAIVPLVHPTIGWVCIAMIAILGPRLFYLYLNRALFAPSESPR